MSTAGASLSGATPAIDLPDLDEEGDKGRCNHQEGGRQALAAELQLDHQLLTLLDSLLRDHDRRFGEGLDPLHFDHMCFSPGPDQGVFGLDELKSRRPYLHACVLRPGENRLGPVDALGEVLEKSPDFVALFELRRARLVAGGARGVLPSGQQRIRRLQHVVIAMARDACGLPQIAERFLVQKQGMSVPPDVERVSAGRPLRTMPFVPHFLLRDLFGWLAALGVLAALAAIYPWELGQKADPFAPAPAGIRPEWYFIFMFQTLKYIPAKIGPFDGEVLAVLGFGLGGLFLLLVPFLDKRAARGEPSPLFRWIGIGIILYIAVFTALGYLAPGGK